MSRAKRTASLSVVLFAVAGCGDRLSQGDRCILVGEGLAVIGVEDMPEHRSHDRGLATMNDLLGKPTTSELVSVGTRVSVASDDSEEDGPYRRVRILLLDPPYSGLTGTVRRSNLKPE